MAEARGDALLPSDSEPVAPAAALPLDDGEARLLTLPMTDGGKVDAARVPAAKRRKLAQLARDPEFRELFDLPAPPEGSDEPAAAPPFDASILSIVAGPLQMVLNGLIRRQYGLTLQQAMAVVSLDENQRAAIVPLATKVANKWVPDLGPWSDEITLGVLVLAIVQSKLALAQAFAAQNQQMQRGPSAVMPFPHNPEAAAAAVVES